MSSVRHEGGGPVSVIVVGLEQRQSPLDLLERVAVPESALPKALGRLRDQSNLSEAVILSTCLRTEVYAVVERFHDGVAELRSSWPRSAAARRTR